MKRHLVIIIMFLLATDCFAQDDKSAQKNKKLVDKEEKEFEKNLRKNPDTAITYLDHANSLAAINSEINRASGFYKLALKYDSTNALIYKNYGEYLADKLRSYNEAKKMLGRGLELSPGDEEMKKYLASVNDIISLQEADKRMRDFGTTTVKELNPMGNYAACAKFDSLRTAVAETGSKYNYDHLLARFLAGKTLAPDEMYMLIVGFSKQQSYNPFNYNDINEMKVEASHNIDSGINKGIRLTAINPLNPTLNRELMYYYRKKNEPAEADKFLNRVKQFFDGVLYSGNGSCDRPYISLWAREEYNFITYLGLKPTENHSMGMCAGQMAETIDAINPTTQKAEQINFNVGLIYMQSVGK